MFSPVSREWNNVSVDAKFIRKQGPDTKEGSEFELEVAGTCKNAGNVLNLEKKYCKNNLIEHDNIKIGTLPGIFGK